MKRLSRNKSSNYKERNFVCGLYFFDFKFLKLMLYTSFVLAIFLILPTDVFAQTENVGIGTTSPNNSAVLHLDIGGLTSPRGFLVPRMTTTQRNSIPTPLAHGLMIFNLTTNRYELYDSTATTWYPFIAGNNLNSSTWAISGNSATNPANNFVGTTDAQDLVFRTTNIERARFLSGGNFGIGTNNPLSLFSVGNTSQFQVNSTGAIASATGITSSGAIQFSGLTTAGIVFTSATGLLSSAAVSGDGTVTNAGLLNVTGIQGRSVFNSAPTNGQVLSWNNANTRWEPTTLTTVGTVTSVGLALPAQLTVTGSPVTASGTLSAAWNTQSPNLVFAGPSSGPAAVPAFRSLAATDIPTLDAAIIGSGLIPVARGGTNSGTALNNNRIMISSGGSITEATAMTNGQLLIGSTGAAPAAGTLTAGTGITITNTAGAITIASSGSGLPALTSANIWVGNSTNSAIERALSQDGTLSNTGLLTVTGLQTVAISSTAPTNGQLLRFNGAQWAPATVSGTGTVTSVGLALPATEFTITNSPITAAGTLTGSWNTQSQNLVFAGPASGAAATPAFRGLVANDIPNLDASKITSGLLAINVGGTNSNATPTDGGIAYGTGTAYAFSGAGSNGNVLTSRGTGSGPIWKDPNNVYWVLAGNVGIQSTNYLGTSDDKDLVFKTNGAENMRIVGQVTNRGNVGIGINAPLTKLHLMQTTTTSTPQFRIEQGTSGATGDASMLLYKNSGTPQQITFGIDAGDNNNLKLVNSSTLNNSSTYNNASTLMRVHTESGNVGIVDFNHQAKIRAYRNTSTLTAASGTAYKVQFNASTYSENITSDLTTNYRFTATSPGYYQVNSRVEISAWGAIPSNGTYATILIKLNNTDIISYGTAIGLDANLSTTTIIAPNVSDVIYLNTNDYIEIFLLQNSGQNATINYGSPNTYVSIHKLS